MHTWIVEDNTLLRQLMAELVSDSEGFTCTGCFGTAEDALSKLEEGHAPDLILMDVGLPGRSGIDVLSDIFAFVPATRVVILTVHDDDDKVFRALCGGASGYLLKSQPMDEIMIALETLREGGAPINARIASKVLNLFQKFQTPKQDYGLSDREKEVLEHLVDGLTQAEIAHRMHLSTHTINSHVRNIYAKLHVRSRTRAVAKAIRERLI